MRVLPTWKGVLAPEALREIETKVAAVSGASVPVTANASFTAHIAHTIPTTPTTSVVPSSKRYSPSIIKLLTDLCAVFENPPGPRISGIVSEIFKRLSRSGEVSRDVLGELDFKAKQVDKRGIIQVLKQMIENNENPVVPAINPPQTDTQQPQTQAIPLNFELPPNFQIDLSLLSSIVELNKLNTSSLPTSPSTSITPAISVSVDKHFVDIPLTSADLLITRPNLFKVLYDDLSLHCKTCGIRFRDTDQGNKRMTLHLDSHFRRNMRLKEKSKRVLARDLFVSEDDWILAKEDSESSSERTVNIFEDSSVNDSKDSADDFDSFVEATEEEQSSQIKCSTCQETISVIWNDEREQWIFPACIRNESDQIIHVTCQTSENSTKRAKLN